MTDDTRQEALTVQETRITCCCLDRIRATKHVQRVRNIFGKIVVLSGLLSLVSCGLIRPPDPPFFIATFALSPDARHLVVQFSSGVFRNTRKKRASGLFLYDVERQEFVGEYHSDVQYGGGVGSIGQVFTNDGERIVFSMATDRKKRDDGSWYIVWRLVVMKRDGSELRYLTEPEEDTTVYYPALSHRGDKVAYIKVRKEDLHYKKGQSQSIIRYGQIHEVSLDSKHHQQLIPYKINYPPTPAYMVNDQDVAFITERVDDGGSFIDYDEKHGDNYFFVMGPQAGYAVRPFKKFSKEYQRQNYLAVLGDDKAVISLTGSSPGGGRFAPKIILYDFGADTSKQLRDLDDEYRDFDGTALNMHPPSAKGRRTYWRFGHLSHARDAGKVAVVLENVVTRETHIRLMDLEDYSFEDLGIYAAWERVVSGEVTLKDIWVRQ